MTLAWKLHLPKQLLFYPLRIYSSWGGPATRSPWSLPVHTYNDLSARVSDLIATPWPGQARPQKGTPSHRQRGQKHLIAADKPRGSRTSPNHSGDPKDINPGSQRVTRCHQAGGVPKALPRDIVPATRREGHRPCRGTEGMTPKQCTSTSTSGTAAAHQTYKVDKRPTFRNSFRPGTANVSALLH